MWISENTETIFEVLKFKMNDSSINFEIMAELATIFASLQTDNFEVKDVIVKSMIFFVLKF